MYPPHVNEDQGIAYLPLVRQETMMGAASSAMGREAGRGLLTLANLITVAAPLAADWNDSHIFNQRWPSHARFHGVVALAMTGTLAGLNLWSLWSDSTDRRTSRLFAAAIPVGYWAPFLVAPLVPGTGVDDPPHSIPRVAGVPTSLLGAAATTLTAVAGWILDRRAVPTKCMKGQSDERSGGGSGWIKESV